MKLIVYIIRDNQISIHRYNFDSRKIFLYIEEADILCHGNWIELERKHQYIQILQSILDKHHISYPIEF